MELKEARPRFSEKFITIYNSLDFEKVENLANEDIQESYLIQKPYLSAMGRLSDQKNFTMLISSYAKSNINEIYNLAIIGDGPKKEKLEKQIKKIRLRI